VLQPLSDQPLGAAVTALYQEPDGNLLIGLDRDSPAFGSSLLRLTPGGLEGIEAASGLKIRQLYRRTDGSILVATPMSLQIIRNGQRLPGPQPHWYPEILGPMGGSPPLIYAEGRIYRLDGDRLLLDDSGEWPRRGGRVDSEADPEGNGWLGIGGNVYRNGDLVVTGVGEVRGFAFDHEGSVWIAANGLHRLKPALIRVFGSPEGAVDNVYPIHLDPDGTLWFGSFGSGMVRMKDGEFQRFGLRDGLPGDLVTAIHRDRDGQLWVGAYNGSICAFRPHQPCDRPIPLSGEVIRAIHQDRSGSLWVGTDNGLFRRTGGEWVRLDQEDGVPRVPVRVVLEMGNGELWFGTNGAGLLHYLPGAGFDRFTTSDGLSSDLIRSIYRDDEGVLWVGTEGRGLNRLELARGSLAGAKVTTYRRLHGMYEEVIHQILEDDFGRLWMSSNRGLFWVQLDELNAFARGEIVRVHSSHYTERDGLRNREANGGVNGTGVKTADGRLWFGTQAGVAVVDPATIRRNAVPPQVAIQEVKAGGAEFHPDPDGILRLPVGLRSLEIDYTALSFLAPDNVQFRYRLAGFDDDWVMPGNRRTAFYTRVPPGDYRFQVVASNNDGVWNEAGESIELVLPPYFYETGWFRGLGVLLLAGILGTAIAFRARRARHREDELVGLVHERTRQLESEKEASEAARREAERHSRVAEQALATVADQADQLREIDQAKSKFFANVSHEFRTPLTLMIGPLEDVRQGLHGRITPEQDREVSVSLRNARRLLRLVDQLLDVAKLEANRVAVRAASGNPVELLKSLLSAFSPVAERKRITARLEAPDSVTGVWYDPDLIEKVFANLIGNAFKYTPEGGSIRVTVRQTVPVAGHPDFADMPEGQLTVTVRDSGPGIARAELPRVFERFYRTESAKENEGGTGIGLSLARDLVRLHHGTISVEGEEGFGASFTVPLPLGRSHFDQSQLDDGRSQVTPAGDGLPINEEDPLEIEADVAPDGIPGQELPTVLLIDDNPELRRFVSKHLVMGGYGVIEATDGNEGLRLAREVVPDCIISDIMMPGMDGHELCRVLRSDRDLDFVPVILLTAKADRSDRQEGLGEGADDYLTKPFDMSELLARVSNLIASRHRLRDHVSRAPASLHPEPVEVMSGDESLLARVRQQLEANLADSEFTVDQLASGLGQSRSQLYRRLQEILQQSPSELMVRYRLERGADLLAARAGTVSEIAYGVGFKSVSHFCRRFRSHYGVTPSSWATGSEAGTGSPDRVGDDSRAAPD